MREFFDVAPAPEMPKPLCPIVPAPGAARQNAGKWPKSSLELDSYYVHPELPHIPNRNPVHHGLQVRAVEHGTPCAESNQDARAPAFADLGSERTEERLDIRPA